jgi:hypothetical protein
MGVPYTTLVPPIPSPVSARFRSWYLHPTNGLLAKRLANVPLPRATTYFFGKATRAGGRAPHDTNNDGRDGIGFGLTIGAPGTYTASTRTITKTNAFTSYSREIGDLVYISAGLPAGLYKIESKTDASNIVLAAAADTKESSLAAPLSDATGVVTSTGPFSTIAKCQAIITAAATNVDARFRFRCGDTWVETTGVDTIAKDNITIDSFGNGPKPFWNRFHTTITGTGWTQDGATNRWTKTTVANVVWMRESEQRLVAYKKIRNQGSAGANATLVQTTPLSFDVNGTTLGVNFNGLNPNTWSGGIVTEVSTTQQDGTGAIHVNGSDNVRVQGIRFDGWNQNHAGQAYGVLLRPRVGGETVLWDCDVFYTAYHAIGTTEPGGSPGAIYCTVGRCTAGYTTVWTGETVYNMFQAGGDAEFILHHCSCPFGSLPDDTWSLASSRFPTLGRGTAYFGHTNGGVIGLYISWGCSSGRGNTPYAPDQPMPNMAQVVTAPTSGAISVSRTFIVDFKCLGYPVVSAHPLAPDNAVVLNAQIEVKPVYISSLAMTAGSGWLINSTVRIDMSNQIDVSGNLSNLSFFPLASANTTPYVIHSHMEMVNDNGGGSAVHRHSGSPGDAKIFNSVIATSDPIAAWDKVNVVNDTSHLGNNAYGGWDIVTGSTGFDADTAAVIIPTPTMPSELTADSPLYQKARRECPNSIVVEFDQRWALRPSTPSIGPLDVYHGGSGSEIFGGKVVR